MSTISYAQAAKGQAASQPTSQPITSSPRSTSSQAKDEVPTANTSVTTPSVASSDAGSPDTGKNGHSDAEVTLPRQESEMAEESAPSNASAADQSVKSSRESDATTVDSHPRPDGKASRSTSRAPRSNEGPDGRRGRKGKKGRNHDKDTPAEPQQQEEKEKEKEKVVLSEAPLPAVNIWKQRQEQKAKQAPLPVPAASNASTNGGESRKPQAGQEEADPQLSNGVPKEKSAKKSADQPRNGEQGPRRSAPRGARANEKDDKPSGNLPSVEDTSAWPDPKAAASNDAAGQKPQAKAAPAEKEGASETRQSQPRSWQKIDVPHSVVFNTQLPARGGGHRSRGGGRGGRETGSTREPQSSNGNASAQNAATEKPAVVNGTGPAKGSTQQSRDTNTSTRSASQNPAPAVPKRGSVDLPPSKDQRKPSVSAQESVREPASDNAASSGKKGASHRGPHGDIRIPNGESGSGLSKSAYQERPKTFEPAKDGQGGQNGNHNQQHGAREGRLERGRGGYRGRGAHNGAAGQHSQPNSYSQNGQYSAAAFQSRQGVAGLSTSHSGQFAGYGQSSRGRGGTNRWNGSGRSNSNGASYAQRPAPHAPQVGEPLVQQYSPYYHPAQPVYDPLAIDMVQAQLEYYFSVENCCKDMYLRKQMDCQGFVKLNVITGFNRMRGLLQLGGMDLLRVACQRSNELELVVGEDQVERLRNRGNWREFVLKAADRVEELQHDTPIIFNPHPFLPYTAPVNQQYAVASPVHMWNPQFSEDPAYLAGGYPAQFEQNGIVPNGHHYGQEPLLSAGVPDFTPNSAPFTLESLNNISDTSFDRIIILEKATSDSSGASAAGYISSNTHSAVTNGNTSQASHDSEGPNGVANSSGAPTWFKNHSAETPVQQRPYIQVKEVALAQRGQAEAPEQMRYLYKILSQILLRDFNAKAYNEFRDLSLQDADREDLFGLQCLVEFLGVVFDRSIPKPWLQHHAEIPEIFQLHYHEACHRDRRNPTSAVEKST